MLAVIFLAGCAEQADVEVGVSVQPKAFPEPARERARMLLDRLHQGGDEPKVLAGLAMLAQAYDLTELAADLYADAIRRGSREFTVNYLHGLVLRELGRNQEALEAFRRASEIEDSYPPLQHQLAALLVAEQQPGEAMELLEEMLGRRPDDPRARLEYGRLLAARGEFAAAIDSLRKAIDAVPHYGAAHYALAGAYRQAGNTELAEVHLQLFEKYRRAAPPTEDVVLARVEALRGSARQAVITAGRLTAAGDLQGAARVFNELLEHDPENVVAHTNLVGIYGALGQADRARYHYQTGRRIAPQEASLHVNYGVLMLKQGSPGEALEAFNLAVVADPTHVDAFRYLGISQRRLGRDTLAMASFRAAVELDPLDHQSQYLLGDALYEQGDYDGAIAALEETLRPANEKTPSYMRRLAEAYLAKGDVGRAADILADARSAASSYGQAALAATITEEIARLPVTGDARP